MKIPKRRRIRILPRIPRNRKIKRKIAKAYVRYKASPLETEKRIKASLKDNSIVKNQETSQKSQSISNMNLQIETSRADRI